MHGRWASFPLLILAGAALVAGCPEGTPNNMGQEPTDAGVPDGIYTGTVSYATEFRQNGAIYSRAASSATVSATFLDGTNRTTDGQAVKVGDVITTPLGALTLSSRVISLANIGNTYQEHYSVTAQWGFVPMLGEQVTTYKLETNGSLTLNDLIVLQSPDGIWAFRGTANGILVP